jgi:hypothetical protein
MLSTVNSVKEYTGYDVDLELIKRAQAIVEIYVAKDEIDVENPMDLLLLDKITSYQAVYMLENEDVIYKQIALTNAGAGQSIQNFDTAMSSPFMAPLAVLAANGLSWNRSRSVRTGRIFQIPQRVDWKRY